MREKAAEQQAKQIEAAYKKNLEATRKLQDAQLKLETDEWAKRRQQTQYQYSRQIEDLQHQLQTEKDLNETGRQAIKRHNYGVGTATNRGIIENRTRPTIAGIGVAERKH